MRPFLRPLAAGVALLLVSAPHALADGLLARTKVMAKNPLSISISHSRLGTKKAFQLASDHCAALGKVAVQTVAADTRGGDAVSTWLCQRPPE